MVELIKKRYKILRSIGSGGMSEVFLAHDEVLDRDVAVKRLKEQFTSDKNLLNQFKREAKAAAQLVHPNIIGIYDVVEEGSDQYIVMEYVEGSTLKDILQNYKVELQPAVQVTMQLASALQQAHSHKVIHCDIKPQNILMTGNMIPKIGDFGIAKMVSEQTMVFNASVMGSVYYISPEQASGGKVTFASDIYSLGIVLFEMLTGQVPFQGDTPVAVAMMQVEKPLPRISDYLEDVPKGLQSILDRMTAKKPEQRYASAKELYDDLDNFMKTGVVNASEALPGMDGSTIIMPPVKPGEKKQIVSITLDKEALNQTARGWQAAWADYIHNFRLTFNGFVILLTLLVCLISLGAHFYFLRANALQDIPDMVTLQIKDAEIKLKDMEYKVEVQQETSLTAAAGTVLRQIPPAGARRRRGSTIKLFYSVGAEKHTMPDLIGMSLVKAQQTLDEIGMQLGKVEHKYKSGYKIGAIIEQEPRAGEKTNESVPVNIVVNEGTKKLPDLIGKPLSEAEKLVRQLGLRVGEIRRVNSTSPKGTVTATSPEAGMMLPNYYPVQFTVSDGADKSVVGAEFEYWVPGSSKENHRIQIYQISSSGRKLIYSGIEPGGKYINLTIDNGGKRVTVAVYYDGKQVLESSY